LKINFLFFDIKKNYSKKFIKYIYSKNIRIITIDDKFDKRIHAHLCFYPPVPQVKLMNWNTFKGKKFIGWEYIPLRIQFENINKNINPNKKILILSGGSNNKNFTYKILKKINLFSNKLDLIILLGFEAKLNIHLNTLITNSHHKIKVIRDKFNINNIISKSNIIITTFGITVYEIASQQKYPIIFANSKDDEMSASIFHKFNIGYSINNLKTFNEKIFEKILKKNQKFLMNKTKNYSKHLRNGAKKIAKIINENT
jgi:spore coat polysaccharide biosynthesis predicted glycosyltransferase SpsG